MIHVKHLKILVERMYRIGLIVILVESGIRCVP